MSNQYFNMKKVALMFFILLAMFNSACEGPEGDPGPQGPKGDTGAQGPAGPENPNNYDKQIRLTFPFDYYGTTQTEYLTTPSYTHLIKFNKDNYRNLNSITFYANLVTSQVGDTIYTELFNVTDNVAIANSLCKASSILTNGSPEVNAVHTVNLIDNLPSKEISLAVRMRSKHGGTVYVYHPYVVLERN